MLFFQDQDKRTPMHAAAYMGDTECINALIVAGKTNFTYYELLFGLLVGCLIRQFIQEHSS